MYKIKDFFGIKRVIIEIGIFMRKVIYIKVGVYVLIVKMNKKMIGVY